MTRCSVVFIEAGDYEKYNDDWRARLRNIAAAHIALNSMLQRIGIAVHRNMYTGLNKYLMNLILGLLV